MTNRMGVYVHVPFCVHKCSYCDFYSFTQYEKTSFDLYTEAVTRELRGAHTYLNDASRTTPPLESIFFGGGTPSLLPVPLLAQIFSTVSANFPFTSETEITLEANPETVTPEFLEELFTKTPVNRVSLGAQSFQKAHLDKLERLGSRESIHQAVRLLKQFDLKNFNLDLIFGIPGQTNEEMVRDIEEAVTLEPKHISSYSLSLKPAHPLYQNLPENDLAADQYELVTEKLEKVGYAQYEISNYALKDKECAHNLLYWSGGDFLGVGPSAASRFFWDGAFHHRKSPSDFAKFLDSTFRDTPFESTTRDQSILEALFLEIRQNKGVSVSAFNEKYGFDPTSQRAYGELIDSGHLSHSREVMQLTSRGRLLAETVVLKLAP